MSSETTGDVDIGLGFLDGLVVALSDMAHRFRDVMVDVNRLPRRAQRPTEHDVLSDVAALIVDAMPKPRTRHVLDKVRPHQHYAESHRVDRFQPVRIGMRVNALPVTLRRE